MIDTHAHLDFPEFNLDREEVIRRAFDNEVKKIVNIGVDLGHSRNGIEIAEKYENIFAAVGMHPDYFEGSGFKIYDLRKVIDELKRLAENKKVVAIGEIGLDYFSHTNEAITDKQKKDQKSGFVVQIELAQKLDLPVIIHCRDAWKDLYKIIANTNQNSTFPLQKRSSRNSSKSDFSLKFVLHCYSGKKKDTEKFLKLPNVYFSFSGNITYPKPEDRAKTLAEAVQMIPLDRIMLDSDSPFLAPQEFRGKRNEPAYIRCIAGKIAEIKKISVERVERETDFNAMRFFGI